MRIVDQLVDYITGISFEDLPPYAIEASKKQVLDTLACTLAGSTYDAIERTANLYKDWGGKEESTIFVYGGKVPSTSAATINGWLAGITDFDDYNDVEMPHVSRQNVPACLAMAERLGAVNGRDFIVAVAVGYDIECRLSRAVWYHYQPGWIWNPSPLFGFFGCAAATAKMAGLNGEQTRQALSLALYHAGGLLGGVVEGANSKCMDSGRAAAGGILSTLLAQLGVTGADDPIEGPRGVYDAFYHNVYSKDMVTVDLGTVFCSKTSAFKPYPCCGFKGTPVDGTLRLVRENVIDPDQIREVYIEGGRDVVLVAEPREQKLNPVSRVAAQFSLPWGVANAILARRLGPEHYTADALQNKKALDLAKRVTFKLNPYFRTCEDYEPAFVEIRMEDGKAYSTSVDLRYGHYKNPMNWEAIVEKFKDCARSSRKPMPAKAQEDVIELVKNLETLLDAGKIASAMG